MRVAIDATVVTPRMKGTGRVVKNLLSALPPVDPGMSVVALVWPQGEEIVSEVPGIEIRVVPQSGETRWELQGMGREAGRAGVDRVLTLREMVGGGGPPVLMHIAEPPAYRLGGAGGSPGGRGLRAVAKDALLQAMLGRSVRRAAAVTAASAATASWLHSRYGVDAPVIPPGIDPFFLEPATSSDDRERYVLHPSTGDARDNTRLVLEGFAASGLAGEGVVLRLVGTPAGAEPEVRRMAEELGLAGSVEMLGWVSDERLRELYAGAVALAHPSAYEGFAGLQPLEAMAQGTPVIALDAPGVSEALGGACELVKAGTAEDLAAAMSRLCGDVAYASALGERGREVARGYTWEAAAVKFAEVLRGMVADSAT